MGMGLYTSRVVLHSLGVTDYGLYNVIGGIIAMFGFLNGAMTNTTSRFIAYYLGKANEGMLKKVFSMTLLIHLLIAIIIIAIGETIGLWYLQNKLVITPGRESAAFWLYQFSIAATIINILYIPFDAAIVAHERMKAFAYIAIIDAILKLLTALMITHAPFDKLVFYGILMLFITFIDITCYIVYCFKHFLEVSVKLLFDKALFQQMMGFTGWSMFGNFAYLFYNYGINLILNLFFGTAVNAARGIAVQVENVVRQFASNIQTAMNPQIIKSYAEEDYERTTDLIFASSRYCFYLILLITMPVLIECNFILSIWLVSVPEHTVNFLRITLLLCLLDTLSTPLFTGNLATGKIKRYNLYICAVSYTMMPITFLSVKHLMIPETAFVCLLICKIIEQIARVIVSHRNLKIVYRKYFKKVIIPVFIVFMTSFLASFLIKQNIGSSQLSSFVTLVITFCLVIVAILSFGLSKAELSYIYNKCMQIYSRK